MTAKGWYPHSDSDSGIEWGVVHSIVPPVGGGVNSLTIRNMVGSQEKRFALVCKEVGSLVGQFWVSFAVRLTDAAFGTSLGMVLLWDGVSLDSEKGLILDVVGTSGVGYKLVLRRGPRNTGEVIAIGGDVALGIWNNFRVSLWVDRVGAAHVGVVKSINGNVLSPVWVTEFDEVQFDKGVIPFGGKLALLFQSRSGDAVVNVDYIHAVAADS